MSSSTQNARPRRTSPVETRLLDEGLRLLAAQRDRITVGAVVRVTGHYTYCGTDWHGRLARVVAVTAYPESVVPGGRILDCAIVEGAYSDGTEAHGTVVPFYVSDVEA